MGAAESMQQVGESRYTMAHSLVAVLRDGAILPETGEEFTLYKPVIAAINGICAAGGLEMLWNTDPRGCADDAWFQLAEPRRGLFPAGDPRCTAPASCRSATPWRWSRWPIASARSAPTRSGS
jgi:hypothetical protein